MDDQISPDAEVRMDAVRQSILFRSLATEHADVDVWDDPEGNVDDWNYFWIVSKFDAGHRILFYVRLKDEHLEKRIYDDAGDDLWISAE